MRVSSIGFEGIHRTTTLVMLLALAAAILIYAVSASAVIANIVVTTADTFALLVLYRHARRERILAETTLAELLTAVAQTLFAPAAALFVLVFASMLEDRSIRVARAARQKTMRLVMLPIRVRELAAVLGISLAASAITALIVRSPLVLLYPLLLYTVFIVSGVNIEVAAALERGERRSVRESLAHLFPRLRTMLERFYFSPSATRLALQAGVLGDEQFRMVMSAVNNSLFALVALLILSYPLALIFNPLYVAALWVVPPLLALRPRIVYSLRRSARRAKIRRNLIFILTFITTQIVAGKTIGDALITMVKRRGEAATFGLERESEVFESILKIARWKINEALALYVESIPEERYRDFVNTAYTVNYEHGYAEMKRTVLDKFKDYVNRYIAEMENLPTKIQTGVGTTAVLIASFAPMLLLFMRSLAHILMFFFFAALTLLMYASYTSFLPHMPSEYIYYRPRLRRYLPLTAPVMLAVLITVHILFPGHELAGFAAGLASGFLFASGLAILYDIKLNRIFLNHLDDIMLSFISKYQTTYNIRAALNHVAEQEFIPREFKPAVRALENPNARTRGPFWVKLFSFIITTSSEVGVISRDLTRIIDEFNMQYRRLLTILRGAANMMILIALMTGALVSIVAPLIVNMTNIERAGVNPEILKHAMQNAGGMAGVFSSMFIDSRTANMLLSAVVDATLIGGVMIGVLVGVFRSGTALDGRFAFAIVLLYALILRVALAHVGSF